VTRAFDLSAIQNISLFDNFALDIDLSKVVVKRVSVKEIRRAIVTGHYSGVMPDATQEAFGAYQDEVLIGAAAYGPGGNSKTFGAVIEGFDSSNARELIRLWVHPEAPTNTASFIIGRSLKLLPECVGLVVTFADSGQSHIGAIYQATNFYYLGMSNQGTRYVDATGVEVTARLANVYKTRNPDKFSEMSLSEIRDSLGWTPIISHQKHRYAIGVGRTRKQINKQLSSMSLSYPKNSLIDMP
jgi:hypothetical protein